MKKFEKKLTDVIKSITCDRCAKEVDSENMEFQEFSSVAYRGGYASIFGDGNNISIDLCQECLKEVVGAWLRIEHADNYADFQLPKKSPEI